MTPVQNPAQKRSSSALHLVLCVVIALGAAFAIKALTVQPYVIPSASMENTLHVGDRVLVSKLAFALRDPHPGDIVVFTEPRSWAEGTGDQTLIKRVIATGGQSVRCCDASGRLEIRAVGSTVWQPLNEPFVYQDLALTQRAFSEVTIPSGRVWVMGDHRSDSADSLYHYRSNGGNITTATVPDSAVIGKAVATVWPLNRVRTLGTPTTFIGKGLAGGKNTARPVILFGAAAALALFLLLRIVSRRRKARRAQAAARDNAVGAVGAPFTTRATPAEEII
jgi:signal peptidase I